MPFKRDPATIVGEHVLLQSGRGIGKQFEQMSRFNTVAARRYMQEIILVEDSESDAELLERALEAAGVANPIRYFRNGGEALWYLDNLSLADSPTQVLPAILFLDLKLPGASGLEILGSIRNSPAFTKTLRIVLTQFGDFHSIKKAYLLGAHSFLSKPIRLQDISELITVYPSYWQRSGLSDQPS
jgi:CheY-like chemotaxis protein